MELPPKMVGEEVVRRERGITRHPRSEGGEDSLPVLGAFGEFIEAERRRSRNRMLILASLFMLLLILVAGGAVLLGMLFFDRVRNEVRLVEHEMSAFQEQVQAREDETRSALDRLEIEARSLLDSMAQHEEALAQTRSTVDIRKQDVERELADMKQLVSLLDVENKALKQDLRHVGTRLPKLVATVDELLARMGEGPDVPEPDSPALPADAAPGLPPSFELSLLPAGSSRAYSWRLPIPE